MSKLPLPTRLPTPDQYGNYWLGDPTQAPAVLKGGKGAGRLAENGAMMMRNDEDRWFASVAPGELLFQGSRLRYFATPQMALEAMREEAEK